MLEPLSDPARADAASAPAPAPRAPSLPRIGSIVLRSALLPGTGHLATGHRRSGWPILVLALLAYAGLAGFGVWAYGSPDEAASLAVQPRWLDLLKWGSLGLAAAWILVVVSAAVLARPGSRGAAGRTVAGVLTLLMVALIAVPAAAVTHYADVQRSFLTDVFDDSPVTATPTSTPTAPDAPINDGRLNVLLVGSDAGPDRTGVRTDTMVLASLDTRTGATVLFTLPRNLERVPFAPGSVMAKQYPQGFTCGDECLLNAVYRYGTDHPALFPGDPDPGMTALRSAVTAVLGVPIDNTALIDLAGFQKMVDAVGGVTIRVERRLPIGGLDAAGNHVRPSGYIEAGLQHMSGETALAYARSRSDSSDYERVQRQRCLIGAIQRQVDPRRLLTNFTQVASSTADALQTDIPRDLLPDLVKLAFKVKSQPIQSLTFTPPLVNVGRPDFPAIRAAVQAALAAPAPTTATPSASPSTPSSPVPTTGTGATPSPAPSTGPVSLEQVCSYS